MKKLFEIGMATYCWATIVVQYILILTPEKLEKPGLWMHSVNYFLFMTVMSNILVALTMTAALLPKGNQLTQFFKRPQTQSAVLVYITVVFAGYHFLLADLFHHTGLNYWADMSLHYFIPLLYAVYWIFLNKKTELHFRLIGKWLIFPSIYLVFSMVRGAIDGYYPYPFLDFEKVGMEVFFISVGFLVLGYVLCSAVVIFVNSFRRP
jgi:hypothetical protein